MDDILLIMTVLFQVAIRNIRRDAIKAYDKLEKVCSS
jgi:ribosome recycling factor